MGAWRFLFDTCCGRGVGTAGLQLLSMSLLLSSARMALTAVLILLFLNESSIKVHARGSAHTSVRLVISGCRLLRCMRPAAACVLHDGGEGFSQLGNFRRLAAACKHACFADHLQNAPVPLPYSSNSPRWPVEMSQESWGKFVAHSGCSACCRCL